MATEEEFRKTVSGDMLYVQAAWQLSKRCQKLKRNPRNRSGRRVPEDKTIWERSALPDGHRMQDHDGTKGADRQAPTGSYHHSYETHGTCVCCKQYKDCSGRRYHPVIHAEFVAR